MTICYSSRRNWL